MPKSIHSLASLLWPFLTVILLFPCFPGSAQQSKDDKVASIRELFNQINGDSTLHKITLENEEVVGEEYPDDGIELTGYFKGDTLCKMVVWTGLSYAVIKESYYFKGSALQFVYETEEDFAEAKPPGSGLNHKKLVHAFEGRYYFDQDKAFTILTKGKKRMESDDLHHPSELYHNAHFYYGLLIKKKGAGRSTAARH